jgi:peptide deformylase
MVVTMAVRGVEIYGSSVLRRKADPVEDFGPELKQLVQDMLDTVVAEEGVGLAAPQVGKSVRLIVLNIPQENQESLMMPMLNPEILDSGGELEIEEGCLSIPGIRENVKRPEWIRLRYQDLDRKQHEIETDGVMSRVVQHEVDHLDGILFVDRIGAAQRALINGKLKKLSREERRVVRT